MHASRRDVHPRHCQQCRLGEDAAAQNGSIRPSRGGCVRRLLLSRTTGGNDRSMMLVNRDQPRSPSSLQRRNATWKPSCATVSKLCSNKVVS